MEIQIKKAVRAGNSSAVILPKAWLNKEVRIELIKKTPEKILMEVINILIEYISIKDIMGIYLIGSYARNEEDENSDIDILVVTGNIDKEMIEEGIYNILIISTKLLEQKLKQDLFPIGPMLKEAKPLLNAGYLDSVKVKITKKNISWYLNTTEDKLKIIKKALDITKKKNRKSIHNSVTYTLILRMRTLYIIKKLIKNEDYLKKDFIKLIKTVSKGNAYESYLAVKNNQEEKEQISLQEADRLYEYLKKQLAEIKKLVKI